MLKNILLCVFTLLFCLGASFAETPSSYWKEDYQKTLSLAKETKKGTLVVFMGTDWCPWSEKLSSEVLMNMQFLNGLKEDVLFVRLDFPEHIKQNEEQKKNLLKLKEKFQISEFPTLLLLDEEEQEAAKFGYMPLQPDEFKDYIKNTLSEWKTLRNAVNSEDFAHKNEQELEELYLRAKYSGFNVIREKILEKGLTSARGPFFVMEKYAQYVAYGKKIKNSEMEHLREEIVKRDPDNKKGTQLKLAVLDFEVEAHKKSEDPKRAIKPLNEYIRKYGKSDKENLWRVEMMMAQYLFSKKILENAVHHAEASYKSAPEEVKPEILETIAYLKKQM